MISLCGGQLCFYLSKSDGFGVDNEDYGISLNLSGLKEARSKIAILSKFNDFRGGKGGSGEIDM